MGGYGVGWWSGVAERRQGAAASGGAAWRQDVAASVRGGVMWRWDFVASGGVTQKRDVAGLGVIKSGLGVVFRVVYRGSEVSGGPLV